MHRRVTRSVLLLLVVLFGATGAVAQSGSKDRAALQKIEQAINEHYLMTDFDQAQSLLLGVIKACGDKCSDAVLAKAWMSVGLVRGSGLDDQRGAKEAFVKALELDPKATLDDALATPATKATFAAAKGKKSKRGADEEAVELEGEAEATGAECSLTATEVEKNRPIPVSCTASSDADSAQLRYKKFGSDQWETVQMSLRGGSFQATIPCTATDITGNIQWFVRTKDKQGEPLDEIGTQRKPMSLKIVEKTSQEPPTFPGKEAPDLCEAQVECPPGFPGCGGECKGGAQTKGWGVACDESCECETGYSCIEGTCAAGAACTSNSDCEESGGGTCVDGACRTSEPEAKSSGSSKRSSKGEKKNWLTLEFGWDLAFLSALDNVCGTQTAKAAAGYSCFKGDKQIFRNDDSTGTYRVSGGSITGGGFASATMPITIAYDRVLLVDNFTAGARVGYIIGGGPDLTVGGKKMAFLPLAASVRARWHFAPKSPFDGFAGLEIGVGQVDAKKSVNTRESYTDAEGKPALRDVELDAWRKMGQGFGALAGGFYYHFVPEIAAGLTVNLRYMFPDSGFVLEPAIGAQYGF